METTHILELLGGLALFLYGMQMMSQGLEAAAGNRMKQILEKLTANRFLGVAVGAGITAIIQSSSATTVMVVGFVNSGMMTLQQAVWIIMGANIGTTITGQLIALDVGAIAPLFAFIGVAMIMFLKKQKYTHFGQILAGLGVLFIGMGMMSGSMEPLQQSETFIDLMTTFSNPALGILAGAVFTAVIQSSSASVGILQALAVSGLIGLDGAVYVLFGQNIGTCITAVLASIGTSRNAKRTTLIHLMFNVIGTVIFTVLCMVTPLVSFMESLTSNPAAQIANVHTLFNIVTTLLLLPAGTGLAALAKKILPERPEERNKEQHLKYLHPLGKSAERTIGVAAIYMNQLEQEVFRMLEMAKENVDKAFWAFRIGDSEQLAVIVETEEYIDYLNKEISHYISRTIVNEANAEETYNASQYFKMIGNIERIGDHALNIAEYTEILQEHHIAFSQKAQEEMERMEQVLRVLFETLENEKRGTSEWMMRIAQLEQSMDDMTIQYREQHMERMRLGECSEEACIIYSEMLTDFERIGDHALNIAQEMEKIVTE
ncbi:Na/Pi cotransporter family protein [Roseburia sp. 499]|uniref:Na/Pi cotransporter family protein n=1 Tax=Roseburia sp. 499 TaxID=1261634 RepID=UPI0009513235|nr:Na/Pi cotransporter family protein [Roseburia sp. 499]WVK69445.1 Na/Pi cotransporter family protein [Roseburia sp. 499]